MYSLDCSYYSKKFNSINELIQSIMLDGMDPNYEITYDDVPTGEFASDLIVY